MKKLRRLGIFGMTLLCWSFPLIGHADGKNDLPDINFPFIYFSERVAHDVGPRPEFMLQLPLIDDHTSKAGIGGFVPAITIDTLGFTKRGDFGASTNGFVKLYYVQSDILSSSNIFIPYVTMYRLMVINYRNVSGSEDNASTSDWLVPGFQYAGVVKRPLIFHLDAELYQYSHLDNYRIRTGLSYDVEPGFTLSAVYDRQSWNIRAEQQSVDVGMKGHSDTFYLRGIYRFTKDGKQTGFNVAVSGGYENLTNAGHTSLLEPGNIDRGSYVLMIAVAGGILSW
jgi:hypothetical protein